MNVSNFSFAKIFSNWLLLLVSLIIKIVKARAL
jgi:hypothetical protein